MVRFAARAQQPAALNDVIEATTSEFGTFRTCQGGPTMSVYRGKAEVPFKRSHFRFWTQTGPQRKAALRFIFTKSLFARLQT